MKPICLNTISSIQHAWHIGEKQEALGLQRARHLLLQSSMPVVDVAVACGFVSASHFSKCYRELYGRSPQQERVDRKQLLAA